VGDVTTLANPDVVEQIRVMVQGKDAARTQEALPEDIAKFDRWSETSTNRLHSSTWVPTSNTWFAGILKKAVARSAFRDMNANNSSRH